MINTNELMIGNLVYYKDNPIEVGGITENSICFFENNVGVRKGILLKPNEIEPIPITEELLEKCGFVCYGGEDMTTGIKYYDFEKSKDCKYGVLCGKGGFWFGNGDSWFEKISYLHELQVLMHILAKETLIIDL